MEYYKKVGFTVRVDELEYDLGFMGYAVVYQQVYDAVRPRQLTFEGDHVFITRTEAVRILSSLARQYIDRELQAP